MIKLFSYLVLHRTQMHLGDLAAGLNIYLSKWTVGT